MGMMCDRCYHDGCCEGLPYCGGTKFTPAYVECPKCGETFHIDDMGEEMCVNCEEKEGENGND